MRRETIYLRGRNAPQFRARLVLTGLGLLLLAGLWRPLPRHGVDTPVERTDSILFAAVIDRVARGEAYYPAMGTELRARGYPSASVFNWRPPILILGLARAPMLMRVLLVGLVISVIAGTAWLFRKAPPEPMLLAVLAQVGASATALTPLGYPLPETWAGVCLALSGLAYARGNVRSGATLGLAALFVRELAAPYAAVCVYLAGRERRRGELLLWLAGGMVWSVFYAMHANAAMQSMRPGDLAHPSWVQFGGLRFIVATIGFGGWFYLLPRWVSAVALVLLAAAFWAPGRSPHIKGAVLAYLGFFLVVGQPFNQSWGLLTAPVWAIAYGLGVVGLLNLIQQARGNQG